MREPMEWTGDKVLALRRHLGASQPELAELLGVQRTTISYWENSHNHPQRYLRRVLTMVAEQSGFVVASD